MRCKISLSWSHWPIQSCWPCDDVLKSIKQCRIPVNMNRVTLERDRMSPKPTYPDGSTPRVCIVGAGVAGLCAAVQLKRKLHLDSFVVYEKAGDFGGVWLVNSYPGCQVDVPAWVYSYSFAQNPGWSKLNPDRDEMLAYFQGVARKFDIYRHTHFNTEVRSAVWNEDKKVWSVTTGPTGGETKGEETREFDVLVIGTGPFRKLNYPSTFDNFSGPKMHSADWDPSVELDGRVVGVVGSGSSAIQIIPSIAPKVKKLIVYMREPTFVAPKFQISFGCTTKWMFTLFPFLLWALRVVALLLSEFVSLGYDSRSFIPKLVPPLLKLRLWRVVKDREVRKQLVPRHTMGYKLPPLAYDDFFEAFNRKNVKLIRSPIQSCETTTITTDDGRSESLDVLILCTGFKPHEAFAPLQIIGADGVDLQKLWTTHRPETYLGLACAEASNLFFLLGPNGIAITNGAMFNIECQSRFIVRAVMALMSKNASVIHVRASAQAEFVADMIESSKHKGYMQPQPPGTSASFLVTDRGYPLAWPKSNTRYWYETRRIDPSKFEFTGKKVEAANKFDASEKYRLFEEIV